MIVRLVKTFRKQPQCIDVNVYADEEYDVAPIPGMVLIRSTGEPFIVVGVSQRPHECGPGFIRPTYTAQGAREDDDTYGTKLNDALVRGWSPSND